jgi:arylformamidase
MKSRRNYNNEFNNRAQVPEHPQIFARWAELGEATRRKSACVLDVPYGEDPSERLDLFPAHNRHAPLHVFIHGGWFRALDKKDFSWISPAYVSRGVSVALVNYALAPAVSVEHIVMQVVKSLAWLYDKADDYDFNRQRITVSGHSAGGHLAAMMLACRWKSYRHDLPEKLVRGAVAVSGIFDMRPILLSDYVNVDLKLTEESAVRLSPALMTPATNAPLVTAVGALEAQAFRDQTNIINKAWKDVLKREVPLPYDNHFTVCDALATPNHALFDSTLEIALNA